MSGPHPLERMLPVLCDRATLRRAGFTRASIDQVFASCTVVRPPGRKPYVLREDLVRVVSVEERAA